MFSDLTPWLFFLGGILAFAFTMGKLLTHFQHVRKELQLSEERFRAISTYTYDWEIWLGTDAQPLWVNAAASRMTGISSAEALAMPDYPLALVAEKDRPAVRAALALVADGGIIDDQLFQMRRPDGSNAWASLSAQQIFATDGALLGTRLSIRDVSLLIHYQEAMEQKRTLLQSVLDNTSDAIIALNQEFRVIFFNTRFLELWEMSRAFLGEQPTIQELIGEVCRRGLYPPEAAEALIKRRIEHLTGIGDKIVLETPRQDGILVEGFATPLPGIGYLLTYCDVTERKVAEKKEREQAAFVQTILDTVPAPIFYKDAAGLYLGCNTAFEHYIGKSRTNVVGKSVFDLAPPDLAQIYYNADRELLHQGGTQSYETQVVFADGSRHDVLFSKAVFYREDGAANGLVGAILDITERKQAELALAESESRYKKLFHEFETIFNGIPDSLTVWSSDMRVLWANRSSSGNHEQIAGKNCQELCTINFTQDDACEVRRSFTTGTIAEGVHKTQDGRTWGVKAFPLRNAAGAVDRVIRLASDLTERMVLREEAARAAHLAALGELAAGMAHEINNPTSLILLEMPILREAFRDSAKILEEHFRVHGDFKCGGLRYSKMRTQLPQMIAEILDGAERIRQIVEELRDFSHPTEANQFKTVDLNEVVRKALSLVGAQVRKATDHFSVSYAPIAPQSLGSRQRLEQVVINLVINACQALPTRDRRLSIEVGSWPERRRNFIRVADTGIGILPEHLSLITDPFFTTRRAAGGTGLGLSVSTRIIAEHGGTLHFTSVIEKGTTVTIELPLFTPEDQP
jgi:PAS domain S-box-containing protein